MKVDEFETALHHLERAQQLLLEQRERVALWKSRGMAPDTAIQFLKQLEQVVDTFEDHLRILRTELVEVETQRSANPEHA
jgi:hypothetical protein